ncbi:MAG: 4Fe-4S dicluster domain-containing protein [Acidobacteria bacterium]|nr:4Fe-4S dicluster domain-containing protein [Acidobacteriota bacterium]
MPLTTPRFTTLVDQCIHCGLCLPACPTYGLFRTEMEGARGRIDLMRAVADGRAGVPGAFQKHLDLCLACRSCEAACPSGVHYGELVELARSAIEEQRHQGVLERLVRHVVLRHLIPHHRRLRGLGRVLALYQRIGLGHVVPRLLPRGLRSLHALLPPLPLRPPGYRDIEPAIGPRRGSVAFFRGCLQDAFLAGVNTATIRVLQRNGFDVHTPPAQTCCAALPLHLGEHEIARELARRNVDAFELGTVDAVISNAGGCGASLREYDRLLAGDQAYADRAAALARAVRDVSEFLVERGLIEPRGVVSTRAVYVDSCHLRHVQKVAAAPRAVLRSIPGVDLVELADPDHCCGSAGTYNILHGHVAERLLRAKMAGIAETGAQTIVTANVGCYLQMRAGAAAESSMRRVVHVVELLDQSYARERRDGTEVNR